MRYKCGETVIKTTGGNKMTIFDTLGSQYKCIWFDDFSGHEKIFEEEEIVSIGEYKKILISEEREDKINQILGKKFNY